MKINKLILATCFMMISPGAFAEIRLNVEKAYTINLPKSAAHIAIGNDSVADVKALNPTTLMLFGKSYGETSLTVADAHGKTFYSTKISVVDPGDGSSVSLYLGDEQKNYNCSSRCEARQGEKT